MYTVVTSDSVPVSVVQRLASPIHLADSFVVESAPSSKPNSNSRSEPHCRVPASTIRRQRTSRQSARSRERTLHAFDSLPWITALDLSADSDLRDIADLSQISVPCRPIRRRRDSSRRNPISDGARHVNIPNATVFTPGTYLESSDPATPTTAFDPSRVSFEQLMPVLRDKPHSHPH